MDTRNYKMVCISTENNTVNVIPLLQLNIDWAYVISTKRADMEGWTDRMVELLKNKGAYKADVISIADRDDKDINALTDFLEKRFEGEKNLIFNVSGGQKVLSLILYEVMKHREKGCSDYLLYVEGNIPKIYIYDVSGRLKESIPVASDLSIDDILYLYNARRMSEEAISLYPELTEGYREYLSAGREALRFFLHNEKFRRLFFNYMKSRIVLDMEAFESTEELKRRLESIIKRYSRRFDFGELKSPEFNKMMDLIYESAEYMQRQDIEGLGECYEKLAKIDFDFVFSEFRNRIVSLIIRDLLDRFSKDDIVLVDGIDRSGFNEIVTMIQRIKGSLKTNVYKNAIYKSDIDRFSLIESPGRLFEWMVFSRIYDIINNDSSLREVVRSVDVNVKMRSLLNDRELSDAELDAVITTKYGTLIILEMKTFRLKNDVARGREYIAKLRSGPYGRAIIVSPLLSTDKRIEEDVVTYPDYIPFELSSQENVALSNGVRFWNIDKFDENFKKELLKR